MAKKSKYNMDFLKRKMLPMEILKKDFWERFTYAQDVSAFAMYNLITQIVPCDVYEEKYSSNILDEIYKDKSFEYFLYSNYTTEYHYIDELEEEEINKERYSVYLYSKKENLLLNINIRKEDISISFVSSNLQIINKYVKKFAKYQKIERFPLQIGIIYSDTTGMRVKKVKINSLETNIKLNYGKNFLEKHDKIIEKLSNKTSGLYLFHGPPSGGKTSYIKYLAEKVKRLFIFIPTNLITSIDSPSLISVLLNNPNCVLILEDAEKAIINRKENTNPSLVSTVLNLSDGILSSMLGISLIITFNTGKENIDEALIRKGRLYIEHEFKELSTEESNELAKHLNKKTVFDKPTMLGDIYNCDEENYHEIKNGDKDKVIKGFGVYSEKK